MAAKTEFFFRKTEVEYELVVKYLENLGYWENLLLFWMKHLLIFILWVMIFTHEKTPQKTFLFRVSKINTRKRRKICSKLAIMSLQWQSTVFIAYFEYISYLFTPFSSVCAVDFEQLNVCCVPLYQFINVGFAYCCKY